MRLLNWCVCRGEDRRLVDHAGALVTLRVDVPTIYVWRPPQYVLWGARCTDVMIGSPQDRARQKYLNRTARARRNIVVLSLVIRDSFTPAVRQAQAAMERLAEAMAS